MDPAGFDRTSQRAVCGHQAALPNHLIQTGRTHTLGQRPSRFMTGTAEQVRLIGRKGRMGTGHPASVPGGPPLRQLPQVLAYGSPTTSTPGGGVKLKVEAAKRGLRCQLLKLITVRWPRLSRISIFARPCALKPSEA